MLVIAYISCCEGKELVEGSLKQYKAKLLSRTFLEAQNYYFTIITPIITDFTNWAVIALKFLSRLKFLFSMSYFKIVTILRYFAAKFAKTTEMVY